MYLRRSNPLLVRTIPPASQTGRVTNTFLVEPDFPGVEPALDHLVYAAADLEAAVRQVSELCGVRPVEGGRHLGLGIRNYLLRLGWNAYLKVIGPDREQPAP